MNSKKKFIFTMLSILLGFIIGGLIILSIGKSPLEAYKVIVLGVVGKPQYISWTIVKAIPIILTGISVAFAFNTGLFNIGAEGQYIVGTIGALIAGYFLKLPPIIHPIVALLFGMLFGAIWGGIVGFLKAKFNVNEVISSIMMNWIAFYTSNYLLSFAAFRKPESDQSYDVLESARTLILGNWKLSEAGQAFLKTKPALRQFLRPPLNWGLVVAVIAAIVIWYILNRTTLGYQLKAVGFNRDAAEYGGIDVKKNTVYSMTIAGLLSGLAGAVMLLGVSNHIGVMASQQGYGFDGMAVSLIASNNPILCIPAGLLFAGLEYGGSKLTSAMNTPTEIVNILTGAIVFFIAMPKLFEMIRLAFTKKGTKKGENK